LKKFISINGNNQEATNLNLYTNRAFKFGDGVFETIRIVNGRALFLEHHINRLITGAKAMKIDVSQNLNVSYFTKTINELSHLNKIKQGGRIRLTLFRSGEGAYKPTSNDGSYVIEMIPIDDNYFKLNTEGLIIDIYNIMKKSLDQFSRFKTLNSLLYVQASIYAHENKLDDSLILNGDGNIIESSRSNIFIVSNGVLYTPPLEDGCVGGIMRMNIINIAINKKIKVYECSLRPQNLLIADEVFLTNTIKGIEWVRGFQNKRYYHDLSKKIIDELNTQNN
jgi:branched-chain amino acid aminotransferase